MYPQLACYASHQETRPPNQALWSLSWRGVKDELELEVVAEVGRPLVGDVLADRLNRAQHGSATGPAAGAFKGGKDALSRGVGGLGHGARGEARLLSRRRLLYCPTQRRRLTTTTDDDN